MAKKFSPESYLKNGQNIISISVSFTGIASFKQQFRRALDNISSYIFICLVAQANKKLKRLKYWMLHGLHSYHALCTFFSDYSHLYFPN